MSDGLLVQTMQRIMSVLDDIDERKADIKEIYAEAQSQGYDKAAIGVAIREIRGRAKAETPKAQERASIVELYVSAFDNAPRTYVQVPAREAAERKNPSEGEVGSAVRAGVPVSNTSLGPLTAAQSEGAAGANPEEAAPASATESEVVTPQAQGAEFVTPTGEGEGGPAPADPSPAAERPRFARKEHVLRPHCQRPEMCGSYGSKHCSECERAAKAGEDEETAVVPAFIRRTHDHAIGEQA